MWTLDCGVSSIYRFQSSRVCCHHGNHPRTLRLQHTKRVEVMMSDICAIMSPRNEINYERYMAALVVGLCMSLRDRMRIMFTKRSVCVLLSVWCSSSVCSSNEFHTLLVLFISFNCCHSRKRSLKNIAGIYTNSHADQNQTVTTTKKKQIFGKHNTQNRHTIIDRIVSYGWSGAIMLQHIYTYNGTWCLRSRWCTT